MLSVSGLAAVPFALSAKAFANFEQQMARVKALTGATATTLPNWNRSPRKWEQRRFSLPARPPKR